MQENIENIMFPKVLSPLQQELKSRQDKLYNLHTKYIFRLEKIGVLLRLRARSGYLSTFIVKW